MSWTGSSLRAKLLLAQLFLTALGAVTFLAAAGLTAPTFFDMHLRQMAQVGIIGEGASRANADLRAAFTESLAQAVAIAVVVSGIAAVLASFFISERIAQPVRRMAQAARRIAAGHYTDRVRMRTADPVYELAQLTGSFNEMAASLEATECRRAELLADVAHEMRTPVATLEGYMEGLLDGIVEPSPETWARLHGEASRLRRLVEDLQHLSRAEARQLSLEIRPTHPRKIARDALEPLELDFNERGLVVEDLVPEGLPLVNADLGRAVQVLTNLLTNALRYTPSPGTVTLSARRGPEGREVLFHIADTGIGVDREHIPYLFERFYRVDKSRARAAGGSGIGLTIARALVEAMGGRIWAESAGPGKGSTFSFSLPVAAHTHSTRTLRVKRPTAART